MKPGIRTTEFAIAAVAIAVMVLIILLARDLWMKQTATVSVPALATVYAVCRSITKCTQTLGATMPATAPAASNSTTTAAAANPIVDAIKGFNFTDPVASVDAIIAKQVAKFLPITKAPTALQPRLQAIENDVIGLTEDLVKIYVLTKASGYLAPKLNAIEAEFPGSKPVLDKILALLTA